jgi:hypothetical protein
MTAKPTLRLHLFHARDSTKTVILRQGPSKTYRMILWDRDGDKFQDGQWVRHKIYADRSDIAPDGKHFIYFALDGQWGAPTLGSYTVISKPPYFAALRLYPQGDTYGGGGHFVDATRFYVHSSASTADIIGDAPDLERVFRTNPTRSNPLGLADAKGQALRLDSATNDWLAAGRPSPAPDDYETDGPFLYRLQQGGRHLIRDFSEMVFEPILAPYAPQSARQPRNGELA